MASGPVGGACDVLNNAPGSVRSAAGARGLPGDEHYVSHSDNDQPPSPRLVITFTSM